jgi:hypothetical protein
VQDAEAWLAELIQRHIPTPTETPIHAEAPIPVRRSFLISYGERGSLALAQVNHDGEIHLLGEPLGISDSYWRKPSLSPDGVWLTYYNGDEKEWRMHNLRTGEDISLGELGEVSTPILRRSQAAICIS